MSLSMTLKSVWRCYLFIFIINFSKGRVPQKSKKACTRCMVCNTTYIKIILTWHKEYKKMKQQSQTNEIANLATLVKLDWSVKSFHLFFNLLFRFLLRFSHKCSSFSRHVVGQVIECGQLRLRFRWSPCRNGRIRKFLRKHATNGRIPNSFYA